MRAAAEPKPSPWKKGGWRECSGSHGQMRAVPESCGRRRAKSRSAARLAAAPDRAAHSKGRKSRASAPALLAKTAAADESCGLISGSTSRGVLLGHALRHAEGPGVLDELAHLVRVDRRE